MTVSLDETVAAVASYTIDHDMENEVWQKGVAINGLLATEREECLETARDLVDRAVETQDSNGQLSYGPSYPIEVFQHGKEYDAHWHIDERKAMNTNNTTSIGHGVLEFYRRTGEDRYLEAARGEYENLQSVSRTKDGGIPHHVPELSGVKGLWIDSVYMMCPFFARYGAAADDPEAFDEAARQIIVHAKHLQDPHTGLFRHIWHEQPNSYPQSTFWARGNGWIQAAIVDVLEFLPEDHPDRDELIDIFRDVSSTIIEHQDDSGMWYNVVDDPHTPLESSGTLMYTYAFKRALELGIVRDDAYRSAAADAMDVCQGLVAEDGAVRRVAGPPGGPGAPLTTTSYGQGFYLLAASQF
ncbi:glycosyl hydrolase family 88 (plasmid) [Halostagnicola larsenii XH-48]|uniref:Glycosyl hydrolase family 88 n=1 Tax=Halostagnicola larsenii XH-48 TaxID=797299 RepID=W0JRW5_9EURY|nr:glycoside hydrolase family 88 protein [Halostagnicola larsenii]AHG01324.1 glycosyl hydrolase family 88 [Halostagnicola larsenii XH-48]